MTEEAKSLSDEILEKEVAERVEKYQLAKTALDKLNSSGVGRSLTYLEPSNGLGQGWAKTISNMTMTGLVGFLLFLAQYQGFAILRGLMDEAKEQRISFSNGLGGLREEREKDRQTTQKHADEATATMREIARGLRLLNQHKEKGREEPQNDELQGLKGPEVKAEVKGDKKTGG